MKAIVSFIKVLFFGACLYGQTSYEYHDIKNALKNIDNVKELILWEEVDINNLIYNFDNLEVLRIHNSKLDSLTRDILKLKKLRKLTIENSELKSISPCLFELDNLKSVVLRGNNLTKFEISKANDSIVNLDISYNNIYDISEISKLKGLRTFRSVGNGIKELPKELFTNKIVNLYLMNNKISIIPNSVERATKLKSLILNKNNIKRLPNSIYRMKNLEKLDLSHNEISSISNNFENLILLKYLNLAYNNIESVDEKFQFNALEKLYLKGNKIDRSLQQKFKSINSKIEIIW